MTPPPVRQVEKKPVGPAAGQLRGRPNSARPIQVMPPHNVELTLPPTIYDDLRVPAQVNGADLSKGNGGRVSKAKASPRGR
jgi:hypothetical protein